MQKLVIADRQTHTQTHTDRQTRSSQYSAPVSAVEKTRTNGSLAPIVTDLAKSQKHDRGAMFDLIAATLCNHRHRIDKYLDTLAYLPIKQLGRR